MSFYTIFSTDCHATIQSILPTTVFEAQDYKIPCVNDQGLPSQCTFDADNALLQVRCVLGVHIWQVCNNV